MEGKIFVLMIIGMSMVGWVITTWIRARHGYPVEGEWGGLVEKGAEGERHIALLSNENADLKGKVLRIEERVAVLERIVTDKSHNLAAEIDALR
ncbi:MAG: hypothetical protein IT553_06265 [Sphingomonadaceae bacterium]|nr:hypothetical protein [Sphingomonadaceae bacterium]